jgi:hypothetical protein
MSQKSINRNYHRLIVHLINFKKEKYFTNTFTFNNVTSEGQAREVIRMFIGNSTTGDADLSNRIRKAYYHGEEFTFRTEREDQTVNGWIVK